jgi:hypothetical protein
MSNSLLTIDMITKECLRLAHEKATFLGTINRQFDDSFGQSGGKIGDTLRIRLPSQYTRRQGSRVMDVQDSEQQSTTVTAATQDGVDMRFNSRELALDLDSFSKLHLEPAMATLVSGVESDVLQGVTKLVPQLAGTAGTPITSLEVPGLARAKLNQALAPKDRNRSIQMDSVTMAKLVNGLSGLFQDDKSLKEQYREGLVGRTAMADYYENERVWTMNNSAGTASVALDTYTIIDGDEAISVTTTTTAWTPGSVFTIADLYDVHPETKAAYPHLKQFTVLAGSTATNLLISPTIYITGARKNVGTSTGADITPSSYTTKTVALVGSASTNYVQSLMYHKDAFTFVTADLPIMGGSEKCVRKTFDGISLRVWQDADIRNDEMLTRIDILYGYAAIRPQWACRMIGAAS